MKIKTWHFSSNSYVKFKWGTVHCIVRPLWVSVGNWIIHNVFGRGCSLLHWIKMPSWLNHTDDGDVYTWRDWYGDLGCVYHVTVFTPLFQWWWKIEERNQTEYNVEIGYDKLREIFGKDFPDLGPVFGDKEQPELTSY